MSNNNCEWRSAKDPKTGKTYYYNIRTRETTWKMPMEMVSLQEQEEIKRKKLESQQFFSLMESNIIRKMRGEVISPVPKIDYDSDPKAWNKNSVNEKKGQDDPYHLFDNEEDIDYDDDSFTPSVSPARFDRTAFDRGRENSSEFSRSGMYGSGEVSTRRIRTISTIDDEVIELMKESSLERHREGSGSASGSNSDMNSLGQRMKSKVYESTTSKLRSDSITQSGEQYSSDTFNHKYDADSTFRRNSNKPTERKRRNSTGTIYIETTMACQDNSAMIHVVCAVIRTHMINASKNLIPISSKYMVYNDVVVGQSPMRNDKKPSKNDSKSSLFSDTSYGSRVSNDAKASSSTAKVPSLDTIKEFFTLLFSKSQLEGECIIMALIYCERLIKKTKGILCIRLENWRSIMFACLVMASKVWDDLSMWNVDFSHVAGASFDLKRVNELELALLDALDYEVRVSAGEYAKYYFQLRSLIARLGYRNVSINLEDEDNSIPPAPGEGSFHLSPLNINGARKLQLATEKYELDCHDTRKERSVSTAVYEESSSGFSLSSSLASVVNSGLERVGLRRFRSDAPSNSRTSEHSHVPVMLEQLLHAEHNDADGVKRQSGKKGQFPAVR